MDLPRDVLSKQDQFQEEVEVEAECPEVDQDLETADVEEEDL